MREIRKRFSQPLHDASDPKSRQIVKDYLARYGLVVENNPNKFGIDLISEDGSLRIELERKIPW